MPPVKSLGNSRAQYNYKFGLTGFEAALPPPGPVYSDDVFSTYLYEGINNSLTILNDIDLASKGGIIWDKDRDNVRDSRIVDVQSNALLSTSLPNGKLNGSVDISTYITYNSNGWTSPNENSGQNTNGNSHVSWTFRKQPGFFTIKNWTGDGQGDRYLDHDLESVPGFVMVKNLTDSQDWGCYHRSLGTVRNNGLTLNESYESGNANVINPIRTTPTASQIHIRGASGEYNTLNKNYVAYIFAHDDQRFGTNEDESIIKCGSFTTDGSSSATINLGFEPQWLLYKRSDGSGENWQILDVMRGWTVNTSGAIELNANAATIEAANNGNKPTSDGFLLDAGHNNNATYVYVAIRRPHKPVTVPTKLFTVGGNTSSEPEYVSNFVVDMAFHRNLGTNLTDDTAIFSRLTGSKALVTNSTASETTPNAINQFDFMDGWGDNQANNSSYKSWMFRRTPGFFDVVAYDGDSDAARQIPHNLEVKPEMIIIKNRSYTSGSNWTVWHKDIYDTTMVLNGNDGWVNGGPTSTYGGSGTGSSTGTALLSSTSTYFKPGSGFLENSTGETYISYHFASLSGVSKIGTYTGTGAAFNVDCGFSSSARFVLIKRADEIAPGNAGNWRVYDTSQGIVDDGNDPYFQLNRQDAQITNNDGIDPYQNGFALTGSGNYEINADGGTYIYLAIA